MIFANEQCSLLLVREAHSGFKTPRGDWVVLKKPTIDVDAYCEESDNDGYMVLAANKKARRVLNKGFRMVAARRLGTRSRTHQAAFSVRLSIAPLKSERAPRCAQWSSHCTGPV
jgi:hypothetical protein